MVQASQKGFGRGGNLSERLRVNRFRSRLGVEARIVRVTVDGREIVFAVDSASDDPIAHALMEGSFPDSPANELWRHLVVPGSTVIDVGANLGSYSLPAAAAGATVLAVEASPVHSELIRLAAASGGIARRIEVLQAAVGASPGSTQFAVAGPWGHVAVPGESDTIEVSVVPLDQVLAERGWTKVSLMKIDVEGSEVEALEGMSGLLAEDDAPPLLIEANGHMLHNYGHRPNDVIATLERHGYCCYLVDETRLAPVQSADVQPDCVADYLACKRTPPGLAPWRFGEPLSRDETIARVLATCRDPAPPSRAYGERLLATAPTWVLSDERVKQLMAERQPGPGRPAMTTASAPAVTPVFEVPVQAGDRSFQLVLPEGSDDPIVAAYARGEQPNAYLMDLLRRFAPGGGTVLDLGCHTGTFAVAAAVAGYRVVAVDASSLHVEVVSRSAARNDLAGLTVIHAAVSDRSGTVAFRSDGLFGMVVDDDAASKAGVITVPASPVPALLDQAGVDHRSVVFVKADVEGCELAAFSGMAEILARPDAPPIVYESNPMTSKPMGFSVDGIRTALELLGYRTYRNEGDRFLVCPPLEPQPEAWLDVIALKESHVEASGVTTGAWSFAELVERTLQWGVMDHSNVREYVGELLIANWLKLSSDPRIVELAARLQRDAAPEVRATVAGLALN